MASLPASDASSAAARFFFLTVVTGAIPEARMTNTGRPMAAHDIAFGVFAFHVVEEDVLGNDHVAFHSHDFGDVRDFARAVAQACGLDYDVNRGADHFANGAGRQ
jgi:hypothetical protein